MAKGLLRLRCAAVGMIALLTAPGAVAFGAGPPLDRFLRKQPEKGARLPADGIYPQGRQFLFSMYSVVSPELERMKACGFTAIGPYYSDKDLAKLVGWARKARVKCIYTIGKHVDFQNQYTMPSDKELQAAVADTMAVVGQCPEVAAWCVANEELRHWKRDEMRWLRVTTTAIRKADPLRRPIMMYDPNHRHANELAKTVRYLDYSSKGMYANHHAMKNQRVCIRWGVEQEVKAIRSARRKAIPVAVLWMAKDPDDPAEDELIDDWTRHDVYASLIAGAKGIIVWSGYSKRKGFERTFQKYFDGYAATARELNGELGLGQVFLFGRKRNDLRVRVTSGPEKVNLVFHRVSATYPSVAHLCLAHGEHRYLFLVNSARKTVKATVSRLPASGVCTQDLLAGGEAKPVEGGAFDVTLPALGVKGLRLSRADAE